MKVWGQVRWLVTDHLGTPRMVLDKTGSLANVTRHDYLPFGEEVPANFRAGVGGYNAADNVRQKFTSKERDSETGLDWFGPGRYHSSSQGRFTSVDPLAASAKPQDPQTWNRYTYVLNRPTVAIDPNGLSTIVIVVAPRSGGGTGSATTYVNSRNGHARNLSGRNTNTIEGKAVGGTANRRQEATGRQPGGDTPFGVYTIFRDARANANGTQGGTAGQSARGTDTSFGTGIVYMQPVSGEVVDAGRSTIYLHGGGRPSERSLDDYQPLTRTDGCVRYYNADINSLITTVNDLANVDNDPVTNVFIGDALTLHAIADQRDQNGNYLYPELRNGGWGSPDPQGRNPGAHGLPGDPPTQQREEHER